MVRRLKVVVIVSVLFVWFEVVWSRKTPLLFVTNDEEHLSFSEEDSIPVDPYFTSGVQQVWHENGQLMFEKSFGYRSRKYNVDMEMNNRFRIGSNTKLFTAVAIYQLHERGYLNVNDDVADYLNQSDFENFGFPEQSQWCPTLQEGDGSCETITFVQLMSMSSGMVDGLNCAYSSGSWELGYCQNIAIYQSYVGSVAAVVGSFINWPLSSRPGEEFHYTNENFILLTYLIEKLSGSSYRDYLQSNIFDAIHLDDTYYDPWQSSLGPLDSQLGEGYRDYHDFSLTSDVQSSYYSSSLCSDELNAGAISGTGAIISTTADMHTWYSDLFLKFNPQLLTADSIEALIAPVQLIKTTTTYEEYFGQGVVIDYLIGEDHPLRIFYTGGMLCETTSILLLLATSTEPAIISTVFRNNVLVNAPQMELQESLNSVSGTFLDIGYEVYEWGMISDTSIVQDLAYYFQSHPDSTVNYDDDDSSTDTTLILITVGGILAALAAGAALLYMLRPGRQFENGTNFKERSPIKEGNLVQPILPTVYEDEQF